MGGPINVGGAVLPRHSTSIWYRYRFLRKAEAGYG
jgi:hypothetical protein